jgi:hypothetical protein
MTGDRTAPYVVGTSPESESQGDPPAQVIAYFNKEVSIPCEDMPRRRPSR